MFVSRKKYREAMEEIARLRSEVELHKVFGDASISLLKALRTNCFITNEKGHRVRYINASPERQAKAEGRS